MENELKEPERKDVHLMFDRISGRYDFLNRLLSMRRDVAWRKKLSKLIPDMKSKSLLDLATGTGDILLSISKYKKQKFFGVGLDMAAEMLSIAVKKSDKQFSYVRADACYIPFEDKSFDYTTISFGIRNVPDVPKALGEMYRILDDDGRAYILEFSLPQNAIIRSFYLLYFRHILPTVGKIISGDAVAYRYLNQTVETFYYGKEFCKLMENAGFKRVVEHRLTFGVATIYEGFKN